MQKPLVLRLLLVEDEECMSSITQLVITEQYDGSDGTMIEVILAPTAEDALALLRRAPCDMMLTDRRLPNIQGDALVKMVRSGTVMPDMKTQQMPIIVTSMDRPGTGLAMCDHPFPHYRYTDDPRTFFLEKDADFERLFLFVDHIITLIGEGIDRPSPVEKRVIA